jgi:hypothetical protein
MPLLYMDGDVRRHIVRRTGGRATFAWAAAAAGKVVNASARNYPVEQKVIGFDVVLQWWSVRRSVGLLVAL